MSEESAITEEMRRMIGHVWGPEAYEVDKGWIRRFADAIEDPNPLFRDEAFARQTRFGGIVAPPGFPTALRQDEGGDWVRAVPCRLNTGALNGGNEMEYVKPIRPGDTISVTDKLAKIQERDTKKGKMLFFVFERSYRNQSGELVALGRNTGIRY